jgi:hypothetical protein
MSEWKLLMNLLLTKTKRVIMFTEIFSIYSENHRKAINKFCRENGNFINLKQSSCIVMTALRCFNGDVADCCGRHQGGAPTSC